MMLRIAVDMSFTRVFFLMCFTLNTLNLSAQESAKQYVEVSSGFALSFPDRYLPGMYGAIGYGRESKVSWLSWSGQVSLGLMKKADDLIPNVDRKLKAVNVDFSANARLFKGPFDFGILAGPSVRHALYESFSDIVTVGSDVISYESSQVNSFFFGFHCGFFMDYDLSDKIKAGITYRSFLVDPLGNNAFAISIKRTF